MKIFIFILFFCLILSGKSKKQEEDLSSLDLLTYVFYLIDTQYIKSISLKKLIYGAIKGVMNELDSYSYYLSSKEYKNFKKNQKGILKRIGIEVDFRKGNLEVISTIESSPAYKANILSGDKIREINHKRVSLMNAQDILSEFRKKRKIHLVIERGKKLIPISVRRKFFKHKAIKTKSINSKIEYIKISYFSEKTHLQFEKVIKSLKKNKKKALIIDLRNNPGGILSEARKIANLFLKKGTILSIRGKTKEIIRANSLKYFPFEIVILVNSYSASASEILTAALKDNKKALVIGEKTFGKASVQSVFQLPDNHSAVRLTVAYYYTPNGKMIDQKGIRPHIHLKNKKSYKNLLKDPYIILALKKIKTKLL